MPCTTSWMASNGAINKQPPNTSFLLVGLLGLFLSLGGDPCFALQPGPAHCKAKLASIAEAKPLLSLPAFSSFENTGSTLVLSQDLASWSTDLLVRLTLRLQQELLPECSDFASWKKVPNILQEAYLTHFGLGGLSAEDADLLFRGLVVPQSEVESLRVRFTPEVKKKSPLVLLSDIYKGSVGDIDGVVVVAPTAQALAWVKQWKDSICVLTKECLFWDPRVLQRVIFVVDVGVAAFVPEFGVLAISREIVESPHLLAQVVFLHELAHSATRAALLFHHKDWRAEFLKFSGWKKKDGKWSVTVKEIGTHPADELTRLSQESSFSLLPDKAYVGFVFGKSYEQSVARNDPAEEMADAIAAFRLTPERFCSHGKLVAPKKANWIHKEVFPKIPSPDCSKPDQNTPSK